MKLLPPNLNKEIKKVYSAAIEEVGEPICLYLPPVNKQDCPNCINTYSIGESLNIYDSTFTSPTEIFGSTITPTPFTRGRCPVCSAKGYLEQENIKRVKAIVRWNPSGAGDASGSMDYTPAGVEGFNNVLVKTAKCYYGSLRDCEKAIISGVECKLLVPPVLRHLKTTDIVAIAFFSSTDTGHSTNT